MNVVMNSGGGFVEVQGTAEGHAFRRHELDALLNLAAAGIGQLFALQAQALQGAVSPAVLASGNRRQAARVRGAAGPLAAAARSPGSTRHRGRGGDRHHLPRQRAAQGAPCRSGAGLPALADDSGIEVDALGGRPGVWSARYRRRRRERCPQSCAAAAASLPACRRRSARRATSASSCSSAQQPIRRPCSPRALGRPHRARPAAARAASATTRCSCRPGLERTAAELGRRRRTRAATARRRCAASSRCCVQRAIFPPHEARHGSSSSPPPRAPARPPWCGRCWHRSRSCACRSRTPRAAQRPNETDGREYHFVRWRRSGRSSAAGSSWSTPRCSTTSTAPRACSSSSAWLQGCDVVLEIDWQGAQQVRRACRSA